MDFSKYYAMDPEQTETEDSAKQAEPSNEQNDPRIQLDDTQICNFCKRFSGFDASGKNSSIVSYQCYNYNENNPDPKQEVIYQASRARVEFSYDALQPEFATLDLVFPSYDDQELRLMWARLQKWRREIADTPVFLIHLLERDSVSLQTAENDDLIECNILNPIIYYLTRELPTIPAEDVINEKGEVMGGNIIRMLIDMRLVTFEVTNTATQEIKAEVLREEEERRYLDNADASNSDF